VGSSDGCSGRALIMSPLTMTARARFTGLLICVPVLFVACGGQMSLTEYVDRLKAMEARASMAAEAIIPDVADPTDLTPADSESILVRASQIRAQIQDRAGALTPPRQVAELHRSIFAWHRDFIAVELGPRTASWEDRRHRQRLDLSLR
jgi:hypothetical protein